MRYLEYLEYYKQKNIKGDTQVALDCYICKKIFNITYHELSTRVRKGRTVPVCSRECHIKHKAETTVLYVSCNNCGIQIKRWLNETKRSTSKKYYCSHSCRAKYNNSHKTTGTRRSKLETYLEDALTRLRPNIYLEFNKTNAISMELDIYCPDKNIAFEINGIYHYDPIHGIEKLKKIQELDNEKVNKCNLAGIKLHQIDTRDQKRFTEESSRQYLENILSVLDQ